MTSKLYSNAQGILYASLGENDFSGLCTTNACREFPYVKCGNVCGAQCQRMKEGVTAKYDFDFAGAGCASGMSGQCGCKTKRGLYFDERGRRMPTYRS
jgi:hypothetical protein